MVCHRVYLAWWGRHLFVLVIASLLLHVLRPQHTRVAFDYLYPEDWGRHFAVPAIA